MVSGGKEAEFKVVAFGSPSGFSLSLNSVTESENYFDPFP